MGITRNLERPAIVRKAIELVTEDLLNNRLVSPFVLFQDQEGISDPVPLADVQEMTHRTFPVPSSLSPQLVVIYPVVFLMGEEGHTLSMVEEPEGNHQILVSWVTSRGDRRLWTTPVWRDGNRLLADGFREMPIEIFVYA